MQKYLRAKGMKANNPVGAAEPDDLTLLAQQEHHKRGKRGCFGRGEIAKEGWLD